MSRTRCRTVTKLVSCSTQLSMKFYMLLSIKYHEMRHFLGSDKPRMLFFPLINVKMPTTIFPLINVKLPTTVGILTFMGRKNAMLSLVEHEKCFITSGPVGRLPTNMLEYIITMYLELIIFCQTTG